MRGSSRPFLKTSRNPCQVSVRSLFLSSSPQLQVVLRTLRAAYRVGHAEIPSGGMLLLYTDGVTECPSPAGEEFGVERLAGIARVLSDAPAAHIVSAIFDGLAEHSCRERMPDDASVFVIKRLAES